jgi:hypothetical protein
VIIEKINEVAFKITVSVSGTLRKGFVKEPCFVRVLAVFLIHCKVNPHILVNVGV